MTHAFAVRTAPAGAAGGAPVTPQRLERLRDRGWRLDRPHPGCDVAVIGQAGFSRSPARDAAGLVFLADRAAVAARLERAPEAVAGLSDLELLLALRDREGADFTRDLAGAFSVVFLDRLNGAVEAWRDGFGIYPLYYTLEGGALTCASDIRAGLHLSGMALRADARRIADFIHGADVDLDRTVFEGLNRLPPAQRLDWNGNGVEVQRYWQVELPAARPAEGAPAALRAALDTAVAACLRPGETTGAMLSGGLDSSALAGLAARHAEAPLPTLSFVYGAEKTYDETPYIEAANAAFGTQGHAIPVGDPPKLGAMGPLIEEQMDLFLAPGLQKSRRIYAEARALGCDVLIDGHGGDEVISHGYGRLVELAGAWRFRALWREARGAARVHGVPFAALYAGHVAQYAGLARRNPLRRALLKFARTRTRRAAMSGWSEGPDSLIAPDIAVQIDPAARYRPAPAFATPAEIARAEGIAHLRALTDPVMVQSFEVLHRSATAAGLLPRYPFFDARVVSLCLALPSDTKLKDGQSRWILRDAMRGLLPETIRLRADKAEFGEEVRRSVREFYEGQDASIFAPLGDYVDAVAAERLRVAVISGAQNDVAAVRALWRLAVLIHWATAFEGWRAAQTTGSLIR